MLFFQLIEALGGLGLFVLGMKTMADGLQRLAGGGVRRSIEKVTGNRLSSALTGGCLSTLLQSSGAASILIIGFVNAGLLSLYQALGMLIGTGLGTTVAVQFLAFKISFLALPSIFFGVFLRFFTRRRRWTFFGEVLLGFGLLFFGLDIMESRFAALGECVYFQGYSSLLVNLRLASVISGALLAFLVQSGSVAVGIIIALAASGTIGFEQSAAMVLGEVLGTAGLAGIGAIGGTVTARRTVLFYGSSALVSVGIVLVFFPLFLRLVSLVTPGDASFLQKHGNPIAAGSLAPASRTVVARAIANSHTVFSILSAMLFLPMIGIFARFAARMPPLVNGDLDTEPHSRYLDFRVIDTPSLAFVQAGSELKRMAKVAHSMVSDSIRQFSGFDTKTESYIRQRENLLDVLQKDLSAFLVALARRSLSPEAAQEVPVLLSTVNDLEDIGDNCEVILECLRRKKEENVYFSPAAMEEIVSVAKKAEGMMSTAVACIESSERPHMDGALALKIDILLSADALKGNHLERLSTGDCTVIAGLLFMDIISAFARIGETAYAIIETRSNFADERASGLD
ncbi:MAG TPA: Na/Pi symporter [Geobacteraceae bacterium]|nr:Na/Pi symporter [Geobacteraceae bacterium]